MSKDLGLKVSDQSDMYDSFFGYCLVMNLVKYANSRNFNIRTIGSFLLM